jgi:glucans biosynthesis protein C
VNPNRLPRANRTPGEFIEERFKRLFIPLVFGMLVVVPPQIYYEHIYEATQAYPGYWAFYKTVFNFVPCPNGSLSWHHLWFVLYLLIYSMLALPLLRFLRSERSEKFKANIFNFFSPVRLLISPSLVILISQIILRPYFPIETHDLIKDWAYFTLYFLFFVMGIVANSMPKLWEAIGASRRYFLVALLFALLRGTSRMTPFTPRCSTFPSIRRNAL